MIFKKAAIFFLFAGAGLWLAIIIYTILFPFTALQIPLEFRSQWFVEKTFNAAHAIRYDIEIAVDQQADSALSECLLTGFYSNEKCDGMSQAIDIEWELIDTATRETIQKERINKFGTASSWGAGVVRRTIGTVLLDSEKKYTIKIKIHKDLENLNYFSPKLVISTESPYYKDRYVIASFVGLMAILFLAIGLGILIFRWFLKKLKQ